MAGPIRISILADGKQASKEFDSVGSKAKASLGKLGEGLKSAAPPMLAAAGLLGGVVVGGIAAALKTSEIKATLAAQLGLAGDDAKKAGDAAGDLYKQGYGESLQETADITKAAFENGLVSVKSSKAEITALGAEVATYSKLTGEDAVSSTRAVAQMIKTGLAKNATEAFDILTRGQQLGINKNEDLLDTFNEYGTQFRKLGLDGKTSLGLINQLLQGGARDADVAADAVKEFSIRSIDGSKTTRAGYQAIGLDADVMAKKIASGGPAAKAAFGQVLTALNGIEDPVKRNAAGVALFGTQFEDLGGAFAKANLGTAAAGLGQVAGATEKVNAALSATPTAQLETLKRQATQTFVDLFVKYALPSVTRFLTYLNGPGKFIIADFALSAASSILDMADNFVVGLQGILGIVGSWGKKLLYTMAITIAPLNPTMAKKFKDAGDSISRETTNWNLSLEKARGGIQATQETIAKAKLTAKLNADKAALEQKLRDAKTALADPKITQERKAKLNADIKSLESQVRTAQGRINGLKGKTVTVTLDAIVSQQYKNLLNGTYDYFGNRQSGAPRTVFPGAPKPVQNIPKVPVINVYALTDGPEVGRRVVAALKEYANLNGPIPIWPGLQ